MREIEKITSLLQDDSLEKRIAAAIVLGELKAKGPEIFEGLTAMLDSGVPVLQRHALDTLSRIGPKKAVARLFPLLTSSDAEVRRAAAQAIVCVGDDVVSRIRARMATAEPEERRALDGILAELGGKEAFCALLEGLVSSEGDAAKGAALAVRQRIKSADAAMRRSYLAEIEKFLKAQEKGLSNARATAAAIKILGYLEDERTLPLLVGYATAAQPASVRQEALIAMRFALDGGGPKAAPHSGVVTALLDAAADPDRALAQTALHTLGSLALSAEHAKKLEKLVAHPDIERARFVIEQLGRQRGVDAARVLVKVLRESDKRRAEIAAASLAFNDDAVPMLAKALLESDDVDRAWMIRNVLRATAKKITPQQQKQLLDMAIVRIEAEGRGWEALLDVARDADADSAAAALRGLASRIRKSGNAEKALAVLSILCRNDRATDDDRYARASLELTRSGRDTRPAARAGDDSLKLLGALLDRGFDIVKALRSDRALGLEHVYYVGFHFVEEGHPIGAELLGEVVKKGGRAKLARMAQNKLNLSEAASAQADD